MKPTDERLEDARTLLKGALKTLKNIDKGMDKELAITTAFRRVEEAAVELRQALFNIKGWNHE